MVCNSLINFERRKKNCLARQSSFIIHLRINESGCMPLRDVAIKIAVFIKPALEGIFILFHFDPCSKDNVLKVIRGDIILHHS
jgi:hypothetical protein